MTKRKQNPDAQGTSLQGRNEPKIRIAKENNEAYQPPRRGVILLELLILAFFVVFTSRFWILQVHQGADFAIQAQNNHWREEKVSAPRGRIFDVNSNVLADNRTTFGLSLIRDDVRDLTATLARVSVWTGLPLEQIEERYRQSRFKVKSFEPLLLAQDLDFALMARIESELYAWPGLEIVVLTRRSYPEKDLFAHVLGYVAGRALPREEFDAFINEKSHAIGMVFVAIFVLIVAYLAYQGFKKK